MKLKFQKLTIRKLFPWSVYWMKSGRFYELLIVLVCLRKMPLKSFLNTLGSWVASPLDFLESAWQWNVHSLVPLALTECLAGIDLTSTFWTAVGCSCIRNKRSDFIEHCGLQSKIQKITQWTINYIIVLSPELILAYDVLYIYDVSVHILSASNSCMNYLQQI